MRKALRLKFYQNPDLAAKLVATGNTTLVEASPRDNIWGIGITATEASRGEEWQGLNLLGKSLMIVRSEL